MKNSTKASIKKQSMIAILMASVACGNMSQLMPHKSTHSSLLSRADDAGNDDGVLLPLIDRSTPIIASDVPYHAVSNEGSAAVGSVISSPDAKEIGLVGDSGYIPAAAPELPPPVSQGGGFNGGASDMPPTPTGSLPAPTTEVPSGSGPTSPTTATTSLPSPFPVDAPSAQPPPVSPSMGTKATTVDIAPTAGASSGVVALLAAIGQMQADLAKAIDDYARSNLFTLRDGRAARDKFTPNHVVGTLSPSSYRFATPLDSTNGQRLAEALMYRNAVDRMISSGDVRAAQKHQLVRVADASLQSADQAMGASKLDMIEFGMQLAYMALDTVASATPQKWATEAYESLTGFDPATNRLVSSQLRGAAMVVAAGAIGTEVAFSVGVVMSVAAGVAAIATIVYAVDHSDEITAGIKDAVTEAGKVTDAAGKIGLSRAPDLSKFADDLILPSRKDHILNGDKDKDGFYSGAHLYPGKPVRPGEHKTLFPKEWDGQKILDAIEDVVSGPDTKWEQSSGKQGERYTTKGRPVRWVGIGVVDGIEIKVVLEPDGQGIVTGFPLSGAGVTAVGDKNEN